MSLDDRPTKADADPRFAAFTQRAEPCLVMRADGRGLLDANVGGLILAGLSGRDGSGLLPGDHPLARQVGAFADQLQPGPGRLVRLRLPIGGRISPVTCRAELVEAAGTSAIVLSALDARVEIRVEPPISAPEHVTADDDQAGECVPALPATEETPVSEAALESTHREVAAAPEEPVQAPEPETVPESAPPEPAAVAEPSEPVADALHHDDPKPEAEAPLSRRRYPARFVWQSDASGRFVMVSAEFASAVGEEPELLGRSWAELDADLGLDADGALTRALEGRDTWSGVHITWPAQDGREFPIELAALPVFDRDRAFRGFRGFGVVQAPLDDADQAPLEDLAPAVPPDQAPTETVSPPSIAEPEQSAVIGDPGYTAAALAEALAPLLPSGRPDLKPNEQSAFRAIARALGADPDDIEAVADRVADGIRESDDVAFAPDDAETPEAFFEEAPADEPDVASPTNEAKDEDRRSAPPRQALPSAFAGRLALGSRPDETAVLEALPTPLLVHRFGTPLFANRAFLDVIGLEDLGALAVHGIDNLFGEDERAEAAPRRAVILDADGRSLDVDANLRSIQWDGEAASLLALIPRIEIPSNTAPASIDTDAAGRIAAAEDAAEAADQRARELRAILDTATDGVVVLDLAGRILSVNRCTEALFGYEAEELEGRNFTLLLAAESHRTALDYLDGLRANGVASVLNDGRAVTGVVRRGGPIPLFMTLGRIGERGQPKFCAVLRDITQFKKAEEELRAAKVQAEHASLQKSDFLARVSHEIRTPLNAMLGFAEVMMEERFGPIGTERYRDYLRDIHASGSHIISLVNDLLDLSKIEAGKLDLDFTSVSINEVVAGSVALLQPEANRNQIIIRTAFAGRMPPVVADLRSLKQITLNLLSNAVRYTPAGGQVIVSTALTDLGQAVIRVRDTGHGMNEKEIATALEPFRQLPNNAGGGTGLGLPLTKALVEANRATFAIQSAIGTGTLVEVIFPPTRVLAE